MLTFVSVDMPVEVLESAGEVDRFVDRKAQLRVGIHNSHSSDRDGANRDQDRPSLEEGSNTGGPDRRRLRSGTGGRLFGLRPIALVAAVLFYLPVQWRRASGSLFQGQ